MRLSVIRKRIAWLMNAAVILVVIVLVAVCLGLILSGAGDTNGSEAVRGLTYVAIGVLVVDILALVGYQATAVLLLLDRFDSVDGSKSDVTESDSKSSS